MIIDRVAEFIRRYQMIVPGDMVLTGFSGGADSVLLLELLLELSEKGGFRVQAVHVHHNLRDREADEDARFAEQFCASRGVPFFLYSCPVEAVAKEQRLSLEEAGRVERRRVFEECRQACGGTKVALAHHRNDLAETMIHHLARGTSLSGLAALRPVRGSLIRPLLCLERPEIEEELRRRGISWREDSTNAADEYTRNGIRHHVIPYLEQKVNRRAVEHMAKTSLDLMEAEEYFFAQAKRLFERYAVPGAGEVELSEQICREPAILQRYLVRDCLELVAGKRKDLEREHLESVRNLLEKQTGKYVCLPYGMKAVRGYHGIVIRKTKQGSSGAWKEEKLVEITGEGIYDWRNWQVKVSIGKNGEPARQPGPAAVRPSGEGSDFEPVQPAERLPDFERISENKYTKCFNYDKIKAGLVLRTRERGDFLTVRSDGGKKKLKDYMIDAKIPREQRDSVLLVADGPEIVWVVGYRVSEKYRVREGTEKIIQLEVSGGYTNE